jgi:hypothetical protein
MLTSAAFVAVNSEAEDTKIGLAGLVIVIILVIVPTMTTMEITVPVISATTEISL